MRHAHIEQHDVDVGGTIAVDFQRFLAVDGKPHAKPAPLQSIEQHVTDGGFDVFRTGTAAGEEVIVFSLSAEPETRELRQR